ncbi:alpha/beta hydrolase [Paenibacillus chartarius]|uniref:Alpha/beta hydrolase n=1 Tax=Paenibacillus chartarius TaxID=747481 RepID=A0ABV6DPS8_9BACL
MTDPSGRELGVYIWEPEQGTVRGIVQIAHGMSEHAGRYRRVAQRLTEAGYAVYAADHLGHGRSKGRYWGDLGNGGFRRLADNAKQIADEADREQSERGAGDRLPIFLIGHSMGSFVSQLATLLYPDRYQGLLLSAAGYKKGPLLALGERVARIELALRREEGAPSRLLDRMTFGAYNRSFKPARTPYDWLSSDAEQVDLYIADEMCGSVMPAIFYREFLRGLRLLYSPRLWSQLNRSLPVMIMAGAEDPMSSGGKEIAALEREYRMAGAADVKVKLYPGMRHEIFNERGRDGVLEDVVRTFEGWYDS